MPPHAQLDEAHNIKERSSNTAKATFELESKYKWCLSGTPLQNRVGELYSLVRFLGGDPFSFYFCKLNHNFRCLSRFSVFVEGKRCDCKSLHWKFSDKRTCDGRFKRSSTLCCLLLKLCSDCGHSPMQHVRFLRNAILQH